ncbi:putative mitochondrial chaperone BCS1-B 4 [Colletotrichum chlorophyti]|uniref:Putative mitochondrial chaperone BCS1-B 4 n=1 Tax=Colletotrichum chlorophyti TaxID=708187 RepID=A0A1Q8RFR8_9PEZI|nr:putative mitochondrial chaperone BCS1-B 4 [Colletotrichum chlorophyti]
MNQPFFRAKRDISRVGRSSKILRDLVNNCRAEYLRLFENITSIYEHHNNGWKRTITRDIRPIEIVIMNEELKQMLLKDISSFLDPTARLWYARCGLLYWRGYLLYSRPGTGKSSHSMSVAGCFGLGIYVLRLSGINDERLSALFTELPQPCVVLLEDVDAVGTTRSREADGDESDSRSEASRDGVASQEGRIPIMTTNHIEHLDAALIRPGRVDKKIEF